MLAINFTERETEFMEKVMEILGPSNVDISPEFTMVGWDSFRLFRIRFEYKSLFSKDNATCVYYMSGHGELEHIVRGGSWVPPVKREFKGVKTPEKLAELILEISKTNVA